MFYQSVIEELQALPEVITVAESGDKISVFAVDTIDHGTLDRIIGDTDYEVFLFEERGSEDAPRFSPEQRFHRAINRNQDVRSAGEEPMIQARAGLDARPRVNVVIAEQVGILFETVEDKRKFDAWAR